MASKYSQQLEIPEDFPEILKNFTRELLRHQDGILTDKDIALFGATYFENLQRLSSGVDLLQVENPITALWFTMSNEELEQFVVKSLNSTNDDENGFMDQSEFKMLFRHVEDHLKLPITAKKRIQMEMDETPNGQVNSKELIPVFLGILKALREKHSKKSHENKKKNKEEFQTQVHEDVLLHGMPKEEVEALLAEIFHCADEEGSGYITRSIFQNCLRDTDLGLTRKEINLLMAETSSETNEMIEYSTRIPLYFDLLIQLYINNLIESPQNEESFISLLLEIFEMSDTTKSGYLSLHDLKENLHAADLGLTRIQITAAIAEAMEEEEQDDKKEGFIQYEKFCRFVAPILLSFTNFKENHHKAAQIKPFRKTEIYHLVEGMNRHEFENVLLNAFENADVDQKGVLLPYQIRQAIQNVFPTLSQKKIQTILSFTDADHQDEIRYTEIIAQAFQALQWIQEYDHTLKT